MLLHVGGQVRHVRLPRIPVAAGPRAALHLVRVVHHGEPGQGRPDQVRRVRHPGAAGQLRQGQHCDVRGGGKDEVGNGLVYDFLIYDI